MMSKKDALTLGILAVGGVAAASAIAGSGAGGGGAALEGKKGGILGSQQGYGAPTVYNFPAQGAVSFPAPPDYSNILRDFVSPQDVSRGTQGVSSAGKKRVVRPYIYRGGEVKAGAVSVAPWAMGTTTPAEMGVTTALHLASKPKTTPIIKKKEISARSATPGRMGMGKSYAATHGGD
jgi:hypothetical protein